MKLYLNILKLLFNKFILRKDNGTVIKEFSLKMGIVYIKLAQILATQNYGNLFTETDRLILSSICDDCNPISYDEILEILKQEYQEDLDNIFSFIDKTPVGSASVSQVHRAILKNGEEVAIKIKRKDITKNIYQEIKQIRKIIHRFGQFFNFGNLIGSDHALDLYLKWILQETDFVNEQENIKKYQNFADTVNGKVENTKQIKIPKLYPEYCTDNVIVMEFIKSKTINKMELNSSNKKAITGCLNSYIKSSFWALFNNKEVAFHGDPHSGNIAVDEEGNIYFLDMGLLFFLTKSDALLCRKFFLTAYSGNYIKLYNMLIPYGNMSNEEKLTFKEDCKRYCDEIKHKEVTYYFMDMINICLKYEINPPDFLFNMAKAFVCLNGISNFSDNECSARELLQEQTIEFLLKRSLKDCKDIAKDSFYMAPTVLENISKYGLVRTITKVANSNTLKKDLRKTLENMKETLELLNIYSEPLHKRSRHL